MFYLVYGKENCPHCVNAKDLLESKGLKYRYLDVADDHHFREMQFQVMEATNAPARTVPQIFACSSENGVLSMDYIGGADSLRTKFSTSETLQDTDFNFDL